MKRIVLAIGYCALASTAAFAQNSALQRLEKSPRHHEWVVVKHGDREVHCFVVYPEVKEKVTAVVVIHENRGLNDWARSVTDQVAEAGYIAIAPDLLSGAGPDGGTTSDFENADAARTALYKLPQEQVTADLNAAADYAAKLPACSGDVTVAGFCWGGGQSFRFAASRPDLKAAFVFYGPSLPAEIMEKINCPVYGFYGGNDARITAAVPATAEAMKNAGKTFEPVTYEEAGHGFMRSGEEENAREADKTARAQAWERWKKLLEQI